MHGYWSFASPVCRNDYDLDFLSVAFNDEDFFGYPIAACQRPKKGSAA